MTKSDSKFYIFRSHSSGVWSADSRGSLLIIRCILLVHMTFICNWFDSVTVNAIHHEHWHILSPPCLACYSARKHSRKSQSSLLFVDMWNKYLLETECLCLTDENAAVKYYHRQRAISEAPWYALTMCLHSKTAENEEISLCNRKV